MSAPDTSAVSYRGKHPFSLLAGLVVPGALGRDADEPVWVPQDEGVHVRPLVLDVSQGCFVNLLRVRRS